MKEVTSEWLTSMIEPDIREHIELKLAYNATRPYKHGKKY